MGPSVFPKPSAKAGHTAIPFLKPTAGQHRHSADAVLVFAAEYNLNTYICFIESLRKTNYDGDIVFAISILDWKQKGVAEYLRDYCEHVIVYVLELSCFNAEMEAVDSAKGGMRVCQLHHLYAQADNPTVPLPDPREARTIATTRYELYWIWAQYYDPESWIMLIDARDTYFQSNPFERVPRDLDENKKSGVLHFFGVRSIFLYTLAGMHSHSR